MLMLLVATSTMVHSQEATEAAEYVDVEEPEEEDTGAAEAAARAAAEEERRAAEQAAAEAAAQRVRGGRWTAMPSKIFVVHGRQAANFDAFFFSLG